LLLTIRLNFFVLFYFFIEFDKVYFFFRCQIR